MPFNLVAVEDDSDEVKECKLLELEGVKAAESGSIDSALEFFNRAIQVAPSHASAYNNRAQALRLKGEVQSEFLFSFMNSAHTEQCTKAGRCIRMTLMKVS